MGMLGEYNVCLLANGFLDDLHADTIGSGTLW